MKTSFHFSLISNYNEYMERAEFEKLVEEGMERIPEEFLVKLENVAVVVEDEPNEEQLKKLGLAQNQTLLGLYEGVPQTHRGPNYGMTLPDKITIFQKPIELFCRSDEEIREKVAETVWHEIAHHFGTSEQRVREIEDKRRRR